MTIEDNRFGEEQELPSNDENIMHEFIIHELENHKEFIEKNQFYLVSRSYLDSINENIKDDLNKFIAVMEKCKLSKCGKVWTSFNKIFGDRLK